MLNGFLCLSLSVERPRTLVFDVVQGQKTNREDLGQEVGGNKSAIVAIDVVYIDIQVSSNGSRNGLVPSRTENSGGQVVRMRRVRIRFGLRMG